jgi:hypothetical protein
VGAVDIYTHQQIEELIEKIDEVMPVGFIRLDWMPEDREPFELKAFVLKELYKYHEVLCKSHVHRVPKDAAGCQYCTYRLSHVESASAKADR